MTNSQTTIDLILIGPNRPEEMRMRKHRETVLQLAHMIASWDRPLIMLKVRAHVDVRGNTRADELASRAHDDCNAYVFNSAGRPGRGQHWITYKPRPHLSGGSTDPRIRWAVKHMCSRLQLRLRHLKC